MKRFIVLLILAIPICAYGWMSVISLGGGVLSDGYDTTGITFWWRAESNDISTATGSDTNGTLDYSAGDEVAELYDTAAINTTAVVNGTNGLDCPGNEDNARWETNVTSILTSAEGRVGFWLKIENYVNNTYIFALRYDGSNRLFVKLDDTDELQFNWSNGGTNVSYNTTNSLISTTGAWQWIEIAWKTSTNYQQMWVDNASTGVGALTIADFASTPTLVAVGNYIFITSGDVMIDHVIMTKDSTKSLYAARGQDNYDNS